MHQVSDFLRQFSGRLRAQGVRGDGCFYKAPVVVQGCLGVIVSPANDLRAIANYIDTERSGDTNRQTSAA